VDDGLREKKPCILTGRSLPKRDAYRTEEDKVFLNEAEFALVAAAMWPGLPEPDRGGAVTAVGSRSDHDLLAVAVGTGVRWGELTALTVADCGGPSTGPVRRTRAHSPRLEEERHRHLRAHRGGAATTWVPPRHAPDVARSASARR
jgi:hypothetical protein